MLTENGGLPGIQRKKMLEKKGELKLIHVNEHIMDIFEMTGFVNMLNIEA